MDEKIIIEDLRNIISKTSEIEIERIDEKMSLWYELEVDPLDYESIIMTIEEKYGIDISNEEYESIDTIEDIINLIKTKKRNNKSNIKCANCS